MTYFKVPGPLNGLASNSTDGANSQNQALNNLNSRRNIAFIPKENSDIENFKLPYNSSPITSTSTSYKIETASKFGEIKITNPEEDVSQRLCPEMSNEDFVKEFDWIKKSLIKLLQTQTIPAVSRWDNQVKSRAIEWFGTDSEELRVRLQTGYVNCVMVLNKLEGTNFVKPPTTSKFFGCDDEGKTLGVQAALLHKSA